MSNKPASELRVGDVIEVNGAMRPVLGVVGGEGHDVRIKVAMGDGGDMTVSRPADEEIEVFPPRAGPYGDDSAFPEGQELEDLTYPPDPEVDPPPSQSMVTQTWRIPGGEMNFSIITEGELTPGAHGAIAATMQALHNLVDLLEIRETDG